MTLILGQGRVMKIAALFVLNQLNSFYFNTVVGSHTPSDAWDFLWGAILKPSEAHWSCGGLETGPRPTQEQDIWI